MNFELFIAKRYLISKKSHNAINIISGISVLGIAVGTMALVVVLSAFNGLSGLVTSLYNSFDPDIEVTVKQGKTFVLSEQQKQSIKKLEAVAFVSEVVEGNALLKSNEKQCVATIKGIDSNFVHLTRFDTLMREGFFDISENNMVIGWGIRSILETGPSNEFSTISIYAPKRGHVSTFDVEGGLNEQRGYAAGTFSINDEFDFKYAIVDIQKARKLFDYTNEVTSLEIALKPGVDSDKAQEQIATLLGNKYEVKNRFQQNALLYKTLKSEKFWTFLILVFILIIATFNVIGSLTMLIIEKQKDIAILHHLGADSSLIRKIFLVEGMLITFAGALVGLLLGTTLCWLQINYGLIRFTEGYIVESYPVKMQGSDFLLIVAVVLLIGFFAAWYPVRVFTKRQFGG